MSPEQILCLVLIFAGLAALAGLWREAALDFAEQRFADEFGGDRTYRDRGDVTHKLKSVFHKRGDRL